MPFKIRITSEPFTQEKGAWVSEGVTKSEVPCRFFYKKDGSFSLAYDEKTAEFSASSRLSYDQAQKTLTLSRFGDTRYTAVFGGAPCSFVYAVSAFSFDAVAQTESLTVEVGEKGGKIALTYLLTLGDLPRRITLFCEIV